MDITIFPGKLQGHITMIPSKSQAHRVLICAAFSDRITHIRCPESNQDIEATVSCLVALGADIRRTADGYVISPVHAPPEYAELHCGESGSTLRFMLPIVCALGVKTTIHMAGRLPERPLSPLWEELERMGCSLMKPSGSVIQTSGKLKAGSYAIAGNVSSQFISGLLFALALLPEESSITVIGPMESAPYVQMTMKTLADFGISTKNLIIRGGFPFHSPGNISVEGDWSNGAFWLTASALGSDIEVTNLDPNSPQGDSAVMHLLSIINTEAPTIFAEDIPDLVPILAVYFAAKNGAVFKNISRLRLKESDRIEAVIRLLGALGIQAEADSDTLWVRAGKFSGGIVDACNDHRIAMAAAIAATIAESPVTIIGAECVAKSYPSFWQEYANLGGNYEQYIR